MPYRIAGIDVHKKMLAVVVSDVEVEGDYQFERRMFFQKRTDKNRAKPQCFCESALWKGPTLRFVTEWSGIFSTD
jgi:hypothetical protein